MSKVKIFIFEHFPNVLFELFFNHFLHQLTIKDFLMSISREKLDYGHVSHSPISTLMAKSWGGTILIFEQNSVSFVRLDLRISFNENFAGNPKCTQYMYSAGWPIAFYETEFSSLENALTEGLIFFCIKTHSIRPDLQNLQNVFTEKTC